MRGISHPLLMYTNYNLHLEMYSMSPEMTFYHWSYSPCKIWDNNNDAHNSKQQKLANISFEKAVSILQYIV